MKNFNKTENLGGFYLNAWNSNTEDWVKNRKYIAVLKQNGCHWIQSKKGEGMNEAKRYETEEQLVFSFVHFIGFDTDTTGDTFIVFEREGRQTGLLLKDCIFYKYNKPPLIKEIENKVKQNQI